MLIFATICESIDGELCYFCTPGKPCKKTMFDSENPCIEGKVYITKWDKKEKKMKMLKNIKEHENEIYQIVIWVQFAIIFYLMYRGV